LELRIFGHNLVASGIERGIVKLKLVYPILLDYSKCTRNEKDMRFESKGV
jgi:hypothetical protein